MSEEASLEQPISLQDIEGLVSDAVEKSKADVASLRETSKWIISGVAVAAAGLMAGTSLSSLGDLGSDFGSSWRLFAALLAAVVGFTSLGYLFSSALNAIVPPNYSLLDFADCEEIPESWRNHIENKVRPHFELCEKKTLKEFCNHCINPRKKDGSPYSANGLRKLDALQRIIKSMAISIFQRHLLNKLKRETLVVTPIIALAIFVFSWAANPPDEKVVQPLEKIVDVNQDDIVVLGKALGSSSCADAKMHVIVLGEWRSGVQDVVTVPKSYCPPVRFRLDHGRFSQIL